MIDRIVYTDFQGLPTFDLRLGAGVTSVVGPSDRCKSALLRGLRWVALNLPAGDGFIRSGASACTVAARVDGTWVQRRRGKKENVYQVGDELPHQLERGGAVPEAVAALLNVTPVNFAGQHDPPFWLSDTPGQVAKALNDIVSLSEIDQVMSRASEGVRAAQADVKAAEREVRDAEAELERLPDVTYAVASLEDVQDVAGRWGDAFYTSEGLRRTLATLETSAKTSAAWNDAAYDGGSAFQAGDELKQCRDRIALLEDILGAVADASARAAEFPEDEWEAVLSARAALDAAWKRRGDLAAVVELVKESGDVQCRCSEQAEAADKLLAEALEELGGMCPTCGQPASPSQFLSVTPTSAPPVPPRAARAKGGVDFK